MQLLLAFFARHVYYLHESNEQENNMRALTGFAGLALGLFGGLITVPVWSAFMGFEITAGHGLLTLLLMFIGGTWGLIVGVSMGKRA